MLKLWTVFYTYDEHEMENEVFVHSDSPRPDTTDGREYLLMEHEDEYIDNPELLVVDSVHPLETLYDKHGNPYSITVNGEDK
jgi:hypothetical protein